MALQHREFQTRLRDAERLGLYVQSVFLDQEALNASLKEEKLNSQRWESEAKEAVERAARAERREIPHAMKRRWLNWRPKQQAMPGNRWNLSWPGSSVP